MKRAKLTRIILLAVICIMLITVSGCNYVNRPEGAKNNSADNNSRLRELLVKDRVEEILIPDPNGGTVTPQPDNSGDENNNQTPQPDNSGNDDETPPPDDSGNDDETPPPDDGDDDPIVQVFDSPFYGDADEVITKINAILGSLTTETVDATSATGVKDELMTSRTVKIYLPYNLFDGQDAAVEAIAGNLNMNIEIEVIEDDYVAAMKRIALSGEKADLMYVDQESWGYTQHYTQDISNFVNFSLADELGTFSDNFSKKFLVSSGAEIKYYVASGIGAPYLLAYDKNNILVPENTVLPSDPELGTKEVEISDPITMFNEGNWSVSAFTEVIKESTKSGRVGFASILDDDRNLDIWMGMEGNASLAVEPNTLLAACDTPLISREALDTVGNNMDILQSWFWDVIGNDDSNYVADWTEKNDWANTVAKTFGSYTGVDAISSYSFLPIDISEFEYIQSVAKDSKAELEFVSIPYGYETEQLIRAGEPDEEGKYYDNSGVEIAPFAAGWVGGFSVLKGCENPAVALRVAEELTVAWKEQYEAPILDLMTEDQQARYKTMKDNIGISFYRSIVKNAEAAYATYGSEISERLQKESRNQYTSLQMFSDAVGSLTQPMYRKNTSLGSYDANTFEKWSEFYYGKTAEDGSTLSKSILTILSAAFIPPTMLFVY